MPEIQPFYVYPLDDDEEHLCPVRAMAEWIDASQVTSGFMFRKFTAHDHPSDLADAPMVSQPQISSTPDAIFSFLYRLRKNSLSYFATTSLTFVWILYPMELTLSAVEVA